MSHADIVAILIVAALSTYWALTAHRRLSPFGEDREEIDGEGP